MNKEHHRQDDNATRLTSLKKVYGKIWPVVSLLICLSCLSSCHYSKPIRDTERLSDKSKDSLEYLYKRHYTWNTNLELMADSAVLEYLPIKDKYLTLHKGDRVVVAEFSVHPTDSVDSIWVKLAHTQDEQAWIRETDMKRDFVPTDSISQAIHLSATRTLLIL